MSALPYLASPGNLPKALTAIQNAALPSRVTQDFVKTILQIPGGSGDNMTTFLRRIGFANSDGAPSEIYKRFRNSTTSKSAAADAIRFGYAEIFRRNEYAYKLSDAALKGLIVEITGAAPNSTSVKLTLLTLKQFWPFADFENSDIEGPLPVAVSEAKHSNAESVGVTPPLLPDGRSIGLNLGYTINLNLPATTDINVFNAIFKSLRDHLLSADD